MTDEGRAELLDVIAELRRRYPDWRLGQLIANVADWADQDVWNVEDEQLLEAALLHLRPRTAVDNDKPLAVRGSA